MVKVLIILRVSDVMKLKKDQIVVLGMLFCLTALCSWAEECKPLIPPALYFNVKNYREPTTNDLLEWAFDYPKDEIRRESLLSFVNICGDSGRNVELLRTFITVDESPQNKLFATSLIRSQRIESAVPALLTLLSVTNEIVRLQAVAELEKYSKNDLYPYRNDLQNIYMHLPYKGTKELIKNVIMKWQGEVP